MLHNPLIATWWMKCIRENVGHLRALKFELNSGIDPYALSATWEVHWSYFFSWMLKNTTNLKHLYVSLSNGTTWSRTSNLEMIGCCSRAPYAAERMSSGTFPQYVACAC